MRLEALMKNSVQREPDEEKKLKLLQIYSILISRAFNRAVPPSRLATTQVLVVGAIHPLLKPAPHWLSTYAEHSSEQSIARQCCPATTDRSR